MLRFVRRGLLVAALVVVGLVGVEAAPASAAVPADGTYISCTGTTSAPTAPYYVMVGGAPILMTLANMPKPGTSSGTPTAADVTYHSNCATLFPRPLVPEDKTIIRSFKGHAGGAYYEIVGGAPFAVSSATAIGRSSWSPIAVDVNAIPTVTATTDVTKSGSTTLHGYLHAQPAVGTKFAGYDATTRTTTYYALDSVRHPVPQAAANAGAVAQQSSIDACERMSCAPNGQIVNSGGTGYGVLHVDGWAMDYPSAASVSVRLTAGGSTFVVPADQRTNAVLASVAGSHGFAVDLPIAAGSYVLCGTVLGTTPGPTTQDLGCSNVTVPGARPGKVHRPRAKAKGHGKVRVKWRTPAQNGSPVNLYVVKVSIGAKHEVKQVAGSKHHVVLKHLRRGQRVRVKVKANNLYGFGSFSKKSKTVRAS
jgi:hypothetical protein